MLHFLFPRPSVMFHCVLLILPSRIWLLLCIFHSNPISSHFHLKTRLWKLPTEFPFSHSCSTHSNSFFYSVFIKICSSPKFSHPVTSMLRNLQWLLSHLYPLSFLAILSTFICPNYTHLLLFPTSRSAHAVPMPATPSPSQHPHLSNAYSLLGF